jgi:hypothetical protein
MSTNASISIQLGNKSGLSIYSHWDGYPDGVGRTLLKFYDTEEKVNELISMGDVSILGECIGSKTDFNNFDSRNSIQSLFYGRDRDEKDCEAKEFKDSKMPRYDWNYLFKNGKWYMAKNEGRFVEMTLEKCVNKFYNL